MNSLPLLILVVILIVWNGILSYLFYRIWTSLQKVSTGDKKETIIELLSKVLEHEKRLSQNLAETNKKVEDLIFDSQFYIQKIGLVRFNPFNDTGGDQSFILALIDAEESGVVISGLHTRNGTRWYAKKISNGRGVEHELSNDEVKAIKSATKRAKK
jgi:hypothetical protein